MSSLVTTFAFLDQMLRSRAIGSHAISFVCFWDTPCGAQGAGDWTMVSPLQGQHLTSILSLWPQISIYFQGFEKFLFCFLSLRNTPFSLVPDLILMRQEFHCLDFQRVLHAKKLPKLLDVTSLLGHLITGVLQLAFTETFFPQCPYSLQFLHCWSSNWIGHFSLGVGAYLKREVSPQGKAESRIPSSCPEKNLTCPFALPASHKPAVSDLTSTRTVSVSGDKVIPNFSQLASAFCG